MQIICKGMEMYMKPLDNLITEKLIPSILGSNITKNDRELYSLSIREGGLGMSVLTEAATSEFTASTEINAPLAAIIVMQGYDLPDVAAQKLITQKVKQRRTNVEKAQKDHVDSTLPLTTQRAVHQCREKGRIKLAIGSSFYRAWFCIEQIRI